MVGPITTVVLYLLLVWLYYQQKQILKRQTELSESGQRALPRIRTYRLFSWYEFFRYENETGFELDIPGLPDYHAGFWAMVSNAGKGFAEDLQAELVIKSPSATYSVTAPLAHKTNMDQTAFSGEGGALSPEEGEVTMTSHFYYSREKIANEIEDSGVTVEETVTPTELLWILKELEESPVRIAIFVHFKDGTGVREPIQLLTSEYELSQYVDIRTAYRQGGPADVEIDPQFTPQNT